jgi:fused signal recognition particle receptor
MNELSKMKESNGEGNRRTHLMRYCLYLTVQPDRMHLSRLKQFTAATEVTALAVTKLDGTAKGGVVIGISDQFKVPVKYIGVGEETGRHTSVFNREEYVDSLFRRGKNQ